MIWATACDALGTRQPGAVSARLGNRADTAGDRVPGPSLFPRRNAMRKAVLIASIALPAAFLAPAAVATIAGVSATVASSSMTPSYEYDGG
jgi:hypothetical protein